MPGSTRPGIQWRGEFALKHREEGREEGRVEQARSILREQCELRFGTLPGWVVERIAHGGLEALSIWTRRIVTAGSLEDVFAEEAK